LQSFTLKAQLFALAAIIALCPPAIFVARQVEGPWAGTWRLNPGKSTPAPNSPYRRITSKISIWENGLKVTYDMVGTRGGVTHLEWSGRFDGKDYAVQGVDYVMTNAYSRIDDRSYSIVVKQDGQVTSTVKVTVSADGRTLTAITSGKNAQGQDASTTAVYDRL
jgi:hypothetical protein